MGTPASRPMRTVPGSSPAGGRGEAIGSTSPGSTAARVARCVRPAFLAQCASDVCGSLECVPWWHLGARLTTERQSRGGRSASRERAASRTNGVSCGPRGLHAREKAVRGTRGPDTSGARLPHQRSSSRVQLVVAATIMPMAPCKTSKQRRVRKFGERHSASRAARAPRASVGAFDSHPAAAIRPRQRHGLRVDDPAHVGPGIASGLQADGDTHGAPSVDAEASTVASMSNVALKAVRRHRVSAFRNRSKRKLPGSSYRLPRSRGRSADLTRGARSAMSARSAARGLSHLRETPRIEGRETHPSL
jgi:hypothetical protein